MLTQLEFISNALPKCEGTGSGNSGPVIYELKWNRRGEITYIHDPMNFQTFNSDGSWNFGGAGGSEDCDGKSIDQLIIEGKAYD